MKMKLGNIRNILIRVLVIFVVGIECNAESIMALEQSGRIGLLDFTPNTYFDKEVRYYVPVAKSNNNTMNTLGFDLSVDCTEGECTTNSSSIEELEILCNDGLSRSVRINKAQFHLKQDVYQNNEPYWELTDIELSVEPSGDVCILVNGEITLPANYNAECDVCKGAGIYDGVRYPELVTCQAYQFSKGDTILKIRNTIYDGAPYSNSWFFISRDSECKESLIRVFLGSESWA